MGADLRPQGIAERNRLAARVMHLHDHRFAIGTDSALGLAEDPVVEDHELGKMGAPKTGEKPTSALTTGEREI